MQILGNDFSTSASAVIAVVGKAIGDRNGNGNGNDYLLFREVENDDS
jgi:hypothetical protein